MFLIADKKPTKICKENPSFCCDYYELQINISKYIQRPDSMSDNNSECLLIKISYQPGSGTSQAVQRIEALPIDANIPQIIINFEQIIKRVNSFIQEKVETSNFLQIFVLTSEGFRNLYEFMDQSNQREFELTKNHNNLLLEIQLRDNVNEEGSEEQLQRWERQVQGLYQRVKSVNQQIRKKEDKLEDENKKLIDLAFFYAEPLVQLDIHSKIKASSKQVSFQQEQNKFVKTIKKAKVVRVAFVEINVATVKNIHEALINGVQILHFSCHGIDNRLVIEDTDKIGFRYDLKTDNLIRLLQDSTPNIIVFNVCFSDTIAEEIHNKFKNITTIGYKGKANDRYCQVFAQFFYPKLFSGAKVKQAFELTQKQMGAAGQNFKLFQNNDVSIKPSKICLNQEICVEILSHNEPMDQVLYGVKEQIYQFITTYLNDSNNNVIIFKGPPRQGKSLFIQKCLLYVKQRKKIFEKIQIINLRTKRGEVNSMIWLREEYQEKINQVFRIHKNVVLVFDHCDSIIANEEREFIYFIKKLQKNPKLSKLIIVANAHISTVQFLHSRAQKKPFTLTETDFSEFIRYKGGLRFENKKYYQAYSRTKARRGYPPEYHQKVLEQLIKENTFESLKKYWDTLAEFDKQELKYKEQEKSRHLERLRYLINNIDQLMDHCKESINLEVDNFNEQFLTLFPILLIIDISFNPEEFIFIPTLDRKKSQWNDDIQNKIEKFLKQLQLSIQYLDCLEDISVAEITKKINDAIHIILGFKILPFLNGTFTNESKPKFILSFRKIYGIVLILKRKKTNIKKILPLQMKILMMMWCLTHNKQSEFYNEFKEKLYEAVINTKNFQFSQNRFASHLIPPINRLKELYGLIMKIQCADQNLIDEQDNQIYNFQNIRKYQKIHQDLSKYLKKNSNQCDNTYGEFYGKNELEMMLLPMVSLIQKFLEINEGNIEFKAIEDLLKFQKLHDFLLEEIKNPCCHLIKKFVEPYISNCFTIKKLYLSKIARPKQIRRSQIINQLTKWIEVCDNEKLKNLKTTIQQYKNQSFSSCVALTSIPIGFEIDKTPKYQKDFRIIDNKIGKQQHLVLINPFRFQSFIYKTLIDTFRKIQKTVFPRMDAFNIKSLKKYNEDNLPILISFFLIDCSHEEKGKCQIYIQNDLGLSEIVTINQINLFKSCINIFCGGNVRRIKEYLEHSQQPKTKDTVFIFIDAVLEKERGIGYVKKDPRSSIYEHIRNRKILLSIAHAFYHEFCKVMFKEIHENFTDQIWMSYQVAKARSRIEANLKYGYHFSEIIQQMHDNISIYIQRKETIGFPSPPLKIGQINKSIFEDEDEEQKIECGYNEEMFDTLVAIDNYSKNYESHKFVVIQYDKQADQKTFINNIKIKLRKKGRKIYQKYEKKEQKITQPTASSGIAGIGPQSMNRISVIRKVVQNLVRPEGYLIHRKYSKGEMNKTIKQEMDMDIYQQDENDKRPFRFFIFTCEKREKLENNQDFILIKLNKYSKFNLATYYFDHKINNMIKDKNRSESKILQEAEKAFDHDFKDLDRKEKRDKILESSIR